MPYSIKRYDGTVIATIPDYQYDDTTVPIILFGKDVTSYGQPMAQNLVHMLENFAGSTPPGTPARNGEPVVGMLWYDTIQRKLRVRSPTTNWDIVGAANVGATPPSPPNAGDMWLDTSTDPAKLRVYNGVRWQLVTSSAGPSSVISNSNTGNATSATDNYFTTTNLGGNAEPQLGDVWFDPAVMRQKVFNGSHWQFVGQPVAGIVDVTIPGNDKNKPTDVSTAGTGAYHTSGALGPAQGVFVIGDLIWDNVRNQLFVETETGVRNYVGPGSPYRITAGGSVHGTTQDIHHHLNEDDYLVTVVDGEIRALWSSRTVDLPLGDLSANIFYPHGPVLEEFNVVNAFSGGAGLIKKGLNLNTRLILNGDDAVVENHAGSQAAPSYTFFDSLNTGMWTDDGGTRMLKLSVNGELQLETHTGGGRLYDDWNITGNLSVNPTNGIRENGHYVAWADEPFVLRKGQSAAKLTNAVALSEGWAIDITDANIAVNSGDIAAKIWQEVGPFIGSSGGGTAPPVSDPNSSSKIDFGTATQPSTYTVSVGQSIGGICPVTVPSTSGKPVMIWVTLTVTGGEASGGTDDVDALRVQVSVNSSVSGQLIGDLISPGTYTTLMANDRGNGGNITYSIQLSDVIPNTDAAPATGWDSVRVRNFVVSVLSMR